MPSYTKLLLGSTVVATSIFLAGCSSQSASTTPSGQTPTETAPSDTAVTPSTSMEAKPTESSDAMTKGEEVSSIQKYQSPAGEEQVGFTLVLDKDGVITDAKTDVMGKAPISITRQTAFKEGIAATVKGKKLKDLADVARVGGSSLTTGAFNKALEEMKTQI